MSLGTTETSPAQALSNRLQALLEPLSDLDRDDAPRVRILFRLFQLGASGRDLAKLMGISKSTYYREGWQRYFAALSEALGKDAQLVPSGTAIQPPLLEDQRLAPGTLSQMGQDEGDAP